MHGVSGLNKEKMRGLYFSSHNVRQLPILAFVASVHSTEHKKGDPAVADGVVKKTVGDGVVKKIVGDGVVKKTARDGVAQKALWRNIV
jgi:hypothetical protein